MRKGKHEAAGGGSWQKGGDPFAEEPRPKTKKKASSNVKKAKTSGGWGSWGKGRKAGVAALCCVAGLALLAAGWWVMFVKAPDVSQNDRPNVTNQNPGVQPGEQTPAADIDLDGDGEPDAVSGRKEDYYTFLLLGKDTSSGSTDTIILVSYDVANQTVNCMSIPRDTMVNVGWDIKRVNSVYSAKESSGGGMEGLKKQVSNLTGITPDFYVIIEWKAVGLLVDELGGVEFNVPYNMDYDDDYQNLHIHQKKGLRKLTGNDAMQVVRWRKNSNGTNYGDTVRMGVQQEFLKAVAKQCLQLKNWTKISGFAKIFFENVETDLPLNNLLWFAQQAMGVNMDNVSFVTMPGEYEGWAWSRSYSSNQSYVFAYPKEIVELVNASFNPYNRDITENDLQIMFKNRDGSLGVTNGTVLDMKATSAPVKSSGSSGGSGTQTATPSTTEPDANEDPVLPESGTTTDPGTAGPGNTATPGTTTDPGPAPDPGTTTDPGTTETDPGTTTTEPDPGVQPSEGGETMPEPAPDPVPQPEPDLPPEPELPPE